ncbi:RNA polymerase III-inhibiting protein maf1 [Cytospora paraplurivora]|uniref:Repressor of RNA polymerase III transcription MAF1 n=1 Tax=Cytospora paraplurivora TaxID=2898453 RepID=A0AAN9YHS0_9PEZI
MKFLPLRDFDVVTSALNFDTPDCHVTGGCDLYTTKAAGSDKKLYKNIDKSLETQHAALLKFGSSLSPPQRTSLNLSRSSPFGPLSEISSRRTFAYLIATLNASHPDYDFSQVLRPADFKRERMLRKVMGNLDTTLCSARPNAPPTVDFPMIPLYNSKKSKAAAAAAAAGTASSPPAVSGTESPPWGPHMWALIDKEMTLKECAIFSYQPAVNPFDEDAAAIWSLHYLFFNRERKRVAYLYVRGVPVVSHSYSPPQLLRARQRSGAMTLTPSSSSGDLKKRRSTQLEDAGANKRARYWLGDREAEGIPTSDDDDDYADDGLTWNRDRDGVLELDEFVGSYDDFNDNSNDFSDVFDDDDDEVLEDEPASSPTPRHVRGMSEDIAGRMELE